MCENVLKKKVRLLFQLFEVGRGPLLLITFLVYKRRKCGMIISREGFHRYTEPLAYRHTLGVFNGVAFVALLIFTSPEKPKSEGVPQDHDNQGEQEFRE